VELICEEAAVIFSLHTALNWYFVSHVDLLYPFVVIEQDYVWEASYGWESLGRGHLEVW
jgi:hypothetical protein